MPDPLSRPPHHLCLPQARDWLDWLHSQTRNPALMQALAGLSWHAPVTVADDDALTPVEQVHALALGLSPDLDLPSAAWQGTQTGLECAWLSPVHWHMSPAQTHMWPVSELALEAAESQALCHAVAPLVADQGWQLSWYSNTHWLLTGHLQALPKLATLSLAKAQTRDVQTLMPGLAWPAPFKRLLVEMQMQVYDHPVNQARQDRGQVPVNAFWPHGAGALAQGWTPPNPSGPDHLVVCDSVSEFQRWWLEHSQAAPDTHWHWHWCGDQGRVCAHGLFRPAPSWGQRWQIWRAQVVPALSQRLAPVWGHDLD